MFLTFISKTQIDFPPSPPQISFHTIASIGVATNAGVS